MGPLHDLTPVRRLLSCIADDANAPDASTVVRRVKLTPENSRRPDSIANRLSLLTDSQDAWRSKVPEKDTKMFTVEGKMSRHGMCSIILSGCNVYVSNLAKVHDAYVVTLIAC